MSQRRRFTILLALTACLWRTAHAAEFDHAHTALTLLLQRHVIVLPGSHASSVDYRALAVVDAALRHYLTDLSQVSRKAFDNWSSAQQLAFLINAYNGHTLALVLEHYPLDSIKDIGGIFSSPWKMDFIDLLGQKVSLDEIEQNWLRKAGRFNEPRIHFALNCASIGCPMLREEAYRAEILESQLEDQLVRFLSDRSRNGVSRGVLRISPIFKWYAQDWHRGYTGYAHDTPPVNNLWDYLARYATVLTDDPATRAAIEAKTLALEYTDYDWRLNGVR